jgi:tetrahedral aminopeptidase
MMEATALRFFKELLATPSPSGYEAPIQNLVRGYLAEIADEIRTDLHGNVIGVKNGGASLRLMLAGHCDQIGFCVQYIDAEGYLYVQPIGGWDPQVLIGQRLVVWSTGGPIGGVMARKPIHLQTDEERKQVVKLKDLWLDIGAKTKEEAEALVRVGDPVTLELEYRDVLGGCAISPAMDNKAGLWVVLEAFRRAAREPLACGLYVVSTVQEEIGLRGAQTSAFGIDPQVGVAVDVTHATDCPTIDKKQEGDVRLGGGPVVYRGPNMNPAVVEKLLAAAREREIPVQLAASGRATPNDANALQINRAGMATGLVSLPNRYMHSPVEMISLADLDHAANLLATFARGLSPADDLRPTTAASV